MKALIIGAAGFVGGYLADHLQRDCGWSVCVTKMPQEVCNIENVEIYNLDILEKDTVKEVKQGYECGITLEDYADIKEGDIIESYEMVEIER